MNIHNKHKQDIEKCKKCYFLQNDVLVDDLGENIYGHYSCTSYDICNYINKSNKKEILKYKLENQKTYINDIKQQLAKEKAHYKELQKLINKV